MKLTLLHLLSTTLGLGLAAANSFPADFIPQIFDRDAAPAGGWSLSDTTCPAGAPVCGDAWCCPSSLTCVHTSDADIGEVCCPGTIDCLSAFQASPKCADTTWSLWNSTTDTQDAYGYFCCLPGLIGLQSGDCVDPNIISSPTQTAGLVAAGAGGGPSVSPSSSAAPPSKVTSTVAQGTTTTAVTTASTTSTVVQGTTTTAAATSSTTVTVGGSGLGGGSTVSGGQTSASSTTSSAASSSSTVVPANAGTLVRAGGLLGVVLGMGAWVLL